MAAAPAMRSSGSQLVTRRNRCVAHADDQPLAAIVDDDGRGRGARVFEALEIAHVHLLSFEARSDDRASVILSNAAPQFRLATEARDCDRCVGSHAAADFDGFERPNLGRLRRERRDAVRRGRAPNGRHRSIAVQTPSGTPLRAKRKAASTVVARQ